MELPAAPDAEKSILSLFLQDENCELIDAATQLGIKKESFSVPAYGYIFKKLLEFAKSGKIPDLIELTQWLRDERMLESVGGPSKITEIYTFQPARGMLEPHCEIILKKYKLRRLIIECESIKKQAYTNPEDVGSLLGEAESQIQNILDETVEKSPDLEELVERSLSKLEGYIEGSTTGSGLRTRFGLLNKMAGGFKPGQLIIIAGRTSSGKSCLATNLVSDFIDFDEPGIIFTLEMTADETMDRLIYTRAGVPPAIIQPDYQPTREELQAIVESMSLIKTKELVIDDKAAIDVGYVRAKARSLKRKDKLNFIVVDYAQLMRGDAAHGREREISSISSGMKQVAKDLSVPVLLLAQLNRGPEQRQDGKPKLSDLRESGSLENDADKVILIHRKDYHNQQYDDDVVDSRLILAKNRGGPTGPIDVKFNKPLIEFLP